MGVSFNHPDTFVRRHIGPAPADILEMLAELGCATLDELTDAVIPADIRFAGELDLPPRSRKQQLYIDCKNSRDATWWRAAISGWVTMAP